MIIPVGYGQATFIFDGPALPHGAACTLGFENVLEASAALCAAAISGAVGTADIMHGSSTDVILRSLLVKLGPDETGSSATVTVADVGDDPTPSASPNTTWLIKKQTATGGRHGRGRMYWPGVVDLAVTANGSINPATVATMQGKWDDFWDTLVAGNLQPVVLHGVEMEPTPISAFVVDAGAATQRRRLRR